jgi:molybdate transport repressor ModE-like protein
MHELSIRPQWTIRAASGATLPPRVIELLVGVHEHGSLAAACEASSVSYRHAWELIRQGEGLFGDPLVEMARGRGSRLTPLGEKLVWADRRIHARLTPMLDSLASELGVEIGKLLAPLPALLRIHASHGFAIATLQQFLADAQVPNDLKYCSSAEALAALRGGGCDMAGFHVPLGELEAPVLEHYRGALAPRGLKLITVAMRRQGLMVARGNPKKIYAPADLARRGVRFINRQAGSGTRLLLELRLRALGIDAQQIAGFEQVEFTHAAVAAFVASGMADAGYGVETPARRFKLEFVPDQMERYFLLCDERSLAAPAVQALLEVLREPAFRQAVDQLPGYQADDCGGVHDVDEVFPSLRAEAGARSRRRR